ncbi:hypothetical protein F5H01DRAFT_108055 [Linnemannia elongata]|nr:hypothetical protein F5H01DRAFT_108055 [Linnemannia elongata]
MTQGIPYGFTLFFSSSFFLLSFTLNILYVDTLRPLHTVFTPFCFFSPCLPPFTHTHTLSLSFFFLSSELSHSPPSLFILALISLFTLFPLPSSTPAQYPCHTHVPRTYTLTQLSQRRSSFFIIPSTPIPTIHPNNTEQPLILLQSASARLHNSSFSLFSTHPLSPLLPSTFGCRSYPYI